MAAPSGPTSAPGRWPTTTTGAPKSYVLEMLPYPSGEPHIGHLKTYSVGDAVAHFRRRNGSPRAASAWATTRSACRPRTTRSRPASTRASPPRRRSPSSSASSAAGASRSTGRASSAPTSRATTAGPSGCSCGCSSSGLAYRDEAAVNWCPKDADRAGQRAGHRRPLRALRHASSRSATSSSGSSASPTTPTGCWTTWRTIDWPPNVVAMQENWIGRSEGAEVIFHCERAGHRLPGLHHAPRHAVRRHVLRHGARAPRRAAAERLPEVREYVRRTR